MSKLSFALGVLVLPLVLFSIQAQPVPRYGTATVSGLVTLKGEPSRGVTVSLSDQAGSDNWYVATTNENGRFRTGGIAAGKYWISARAPGYISWEDESSGRGSRSINVAEGEKVENIALEIKRGGVIAGRVTDSQGNPVIERGVVLFKFDKDGNQQNVFFYGDARSDMFRTDDRGVYRIYGLPEGRYLVNIARLFSLNMTSAYETSETRVIEVTEGSEATDIDITLPIPRQR